MAETYEYGNESSGSVTGGRILDGISNYRILKEYTPMS
jgi:hypothetical protein